MAEGKLSFTITASYPDKPLEQPDRFRVIGKSGSSMLYSLLALPDEKAVMNDAAKAKSRLINALSADMGVGDLTFRPAIERAMSIASTFTEADPRKAIIPYIAAHEVAGYGPISMLLDDRSGIEEIMINSPASNIVIYHSKYGYCQTNMRFNGAPEFRFTMNRILGDLDTEISEEHPIIDAQLYDGSRLHAQLAPYAVSGAAASIRLSAGRRIDIRRMLAEGTTSAEALAYLWMALLAGANIAIAGAPATGKTTLLVALNDLMPHYERIITIEEDINELKPYGNFMNATMLQGSSIAGRHAVKEQVINALHLRPDRLIVGEVRGEETGEVFFGANIGVPFITTLHASANGTAVIDRLSTKPMAVQRELVSMLDVSVLMEKAHDGVRRLSSIAEYSWLARGELPYETGKEFDVLYVAEGASVIQQALKASKVLKAYSSEFSLSMAETIKDFKRRASFLAGLTSKEGDVYNLIREYGVVL
ncbi:MAG: type II/IV secretion system ATPase subunit [Candidatus Marsarchaeota archaeon]|nr:type II/IV secretion system ATPase subunit [Candidatus Marsarchaeota archaeon]